MFGEVLREKFSGELVSDMKVNLPANEVWDVYRRPDFGYLFRELMPDYLKQVEYISGDGGLGTVMNVTLQPGEFAKCIIVWTIYIL